jgi:hypothetical protein
MKPTQSHERQLTLGSDWEFAVGRSTMQAAPPPGVVGQRLADDSYSLMSRIRIAAQIFLDTPWRFRHPGVPEMVHDQDGRTRIWVSDTHRTPASRTRFSAMTVACLAPGHSAVVETSSCRGGRCR